MPASSTTARPGRTALSGTRAFGHPAPTRRPPSLRGHAPRPYSSEDCMTAPPLTFLAPPSFDDDRDHSPPDIPALTSPSRSTMHTASGQQATVTVRMTRGARKAATGMKLADADIRRCLDAPDDVSPTRTRRPGPGSAEASSSSSPAPTGWCSGSTAGAAEPTGATTRGSAGRPRTSSVPASHVDRAIKDLIPTGADGRDWHGRTPRRDHPANKVDPTRGHHRRTPWTLRRSSPRVPLSG